MRPLTPVAPATRSALGIAFVLAQALVVLGFALLQRRALRESDGVLAHA